MNGSKTKEVIFDFRHFNVVHEPLTIDNSLVEICDSFKYLGVQFSYNGSFNICKKGLFQQAQRAMYSVLGKARRLGLPLDIQLHLFDTMVVPILLYGGEVWGCGKLDIVERLHLKFCKFLLQVKPSTPNCIVYGELGRYPLAVVCKVKLINYWANLIHGKDTKYLYIMYKIMYDMYTNNQCALPWIKAVNSILDECGLSNVWITQSFPNIRWLVNRVKLNLQDQYRQTWALAVQESSKCILYKQFKVEFGLEIYLIQLPAVFRKYICKLRTCNHRLPIERGRYVNTPRHQRLCTLCEGNYMGDEYHFLLQCSKFKDIRKSFLPKYYRNHINMYKFIHLLQCENIRLSVKVAKFIKAGFAYL